MLRNLKVGTKLVAILVAFPDPTGDAGFLLIFPVIGGAIALGVVFILLVIWGGVALVNK